MKERPILFSAPMVRAIIKGRKTQTRRVIKPQPFIDKMGNFCWNGMCFGQDFNGPHIQSIASPIPSSKTKRVHCPFGRTGDQLWVRETWFHPHKENPSKYNLSYRADDDAIHKWYPSIYMPRWASRIQLEITGIRVERLNDISEKDAIAEGVGEHWICSDSMPHNPHLNHNPLSRFIDLWNSINGHDSWNKNPWVWAIEFQRIK